MALSQQLESIAQAIIRLHREMFDESPSPMKLQKLCYYAQGFALAEGVELFPDDFQAWQHGPVVYPLYLKYQEFRWRPISTELPEETQGGHVPFLRDIVSAYGRFDGAALSTMTHREAPWIDARGGIPESEGSSEVITKESMRSYFAGRLSG